ncbi:MAG: nitrilase-related carbon-nitrogen hydrolase [Acidimicrobiia bacterium]
MTNVVRCALIQTTGITPREAMVDHQAGLVRRAAEAGAQIICLQEMATSPYFCQVETREWFDYAEPVPDGPTVKSMSALAAELGVVLVVPLFEDDEGSYYNTAAVIDADGAYLGKYRKTHIPHGNNFYEKYYFKPGNLGFPVFQTRFAKIGVYICYDRRFPEGARALGIGGAEIVFIPSATAGRSYKTWHVEQRAHAIANRYFVGTNNRVGVEEFGPNEFYGHSYFCDPDGGILAEGGTTEEVVIADLDLAEVRAAKLDLPVWRDRRPETYAPLAIP